MSKTKRLKQPARPSPEGERPASNAVNGNSKKADKTMITASSALESQLSAEEMAQAAYEAAVKAAKEALVTAKKNAKAAKEASEKAAKAAKYEAAITNAFTVASRFGKVEKSILVFLVRQSLKDTSGAMTEEIQDSIKLFYKVHVGASAIVTAQATDLFANVADVVDSE